MAVYTYTGKLTDFSGAPFPDAQPRLWVEPVQPGFSEGGLLATKRIPVTVASNGTFSVQLESSSTVRPEAIYALKCEWLDGDTVLGWTDWAKFRAPTRSGNIGDLIEYPAPAWSILAGNGTPQMHNISSGAYIDLNDGELYLPEGAIV